MVRFTYARVSVYALHSINIGMILIVDKYICQQINAFQQRVIVALQV